MNSKTRKIGRWDKGLRNELKDKKNKWMGRKTRDIESNFGGSILCCSCCFCCFCRFMVSVIAVFTICLSPKKTINS